MKKFLFTVSLLFVALCVTAQADDDYSWYLNKAKEQLSKGECEKAERNYIHYKNLAHDSLPQLYRQIQECLGKQAQAREKIDTEIVFVPVQVPVTESKPETKPEIKEEFKKENKSADFSKKWDNPYCKAKRNRYIAWTYIVGGYPWNFGMGVELRGGGILGVGGYADIGIDLSRWDSKGADVSFRYIGGVRFFYKGVFLSVGYGTIALTRKTADCENSGQGVHFHVGYNGVIMSGENGPFYGVSGGFAYDVVNKVFYPSVSLKLGWAFNWKKY